EAPTLPTSEGPTSEGPTSEGPTSEGSERHGRGEDLGREEYLLSGGSGAHRCERWSGTFDQTSRLPMQIDPECANADRYPGARALFIPREDIDKLHYHQLNPVSDRARLGYHPNKSQGGKEREVQAMSPEEVQAQDKRELEKEQAAAVPARVFVP